MIGMDIFYALADPTRRKILELLASQGQLSATEIYTNFTASPPAISQHLKVLKAANLVIMEKRAQQRIYRLNPEAMHELEDWSKQLAQQWNKRLDALDKLIEREKEKIQVKIERKYEMEKELTLKRIFDAPRELVFKAWTDPALISEWWGPEGFTTPVSEVEARQGGKLYIVMHGPKNSQFDIDLPMTGVFQEFTPPSRLVFTNDALHDENGVPQLSTICAVTFTELGEKTEMTLHIVLTKSTPVSAGAWAGAEMGWSQSLDKLNDYLAVVNIKSGK
jgi:uncharacterized protein YndB with AHSA1/START domain/DNA-binding transcriptional ArsR family regulator